MQYHTKHSNKKLFNKIINLERDQDKEDVTRKYHKTNTPKNYNIINLSKPKRCEPTKGLRFHNATIKFRIAK